MTIISIVLQLRVGMIVSRSYSGGITLERFCPRDTLGSVMPTPDNTHGLELRHRYRKIRRTSSATTASASCFCVSLATAEGLLCSLDTAPRKRSARSVSDNSGISITYLCKLNAI
jgi:hypothetical protein